MYACLWVCGLHVMQLVKTAMFPMSWESWSSGLVRAAGGIKAMDPPTGSLKNGSWNLAETVELERRNQGCFFFHFADYLPTCASIPISAEVSPNCWTWNHLIGKRSRAALSSSETNAVRCSFQWLSRSWYVQHLGRGGAKPCWSSNANCLIAGKFVWTRSVDLLPRFR